MERLTKKIKGESGDFYGISDEFHPCSEDECIDTLSEKLGKLEDIEETLGIDLTSIITLDMDDRFVISVNDSEYKKEIIINVGKNQINELEIGKINISH